MRNEWMIVFVGKSTIAHLLLRFYDPDAGRILLDGSDVKALDPHWLRNQIGFVNQVSHKLWDTWATPT